MILRIGTQAVLLAAFLGALVLPSPASAFDRRTSYSLSRCIMGGYYEKTGAIDKAIEEYKSAARFDRQNALPHIGLASAYLKKNDLTRAAEELTLASKVDPDAAEPHAVLALVYFSQGKTDEAGREYGKALEMASRLDPTNITIYKSLAALYVERNDLAAAERTYKLIIGLAPSDPEAVFFLANVYDEQHKNDEAVKYLKKAIELKPDYHQALNYLGYLYVDGNTNLDEAGRLIDKALALDPGNGAYIDSHGWLLYRRGKYKEAAVDLEKAASVIQDPVIYDHLGDTYSKLSDGAKAQANWGKSLELDAKQEQVRKKLESAKKAAGTQQGAQNGISR
jgi:Tfp pilus assembly protein PilF